MVRRLALRAGSVFLLGASLLLGAARPVRAEQDEPSGEQESAGEAAGDSPSAAAADDAPARPARGKHRHGKSRRHSAKFSGRVVPEEQLRTEPLPRASGNLHIVSAANPNDQAKVNIYNPDGSYNLDAIDELNHVLRCRRTDAEKPIDLQLLAILSRVYDHFGGKPLQIVSGFRNQRKQSSNHFKGRASDIRIAGVPPKKIRAFAETLDRGGMGIGIYPRSQFVHIDVRSPPSYRWVDYSPPNPDAAEKRPPRGWKRKKLES
jgi:uncharacterized protein YcbK (DUF882 family)